MLSQQKSPESEKPISRSYKAWESGGCKSIRNKMTNKSLENLHRICQTIFSDQEYYPGQQIVADPLKAAKDYMSEKKIIAQRIGRKRKITHGRLVTIGSFELFGITKDPLTKKEARFLGLDLVTTAVTKSKKTPHPVD